MDIAARRRNDRAETYTMADAVFAACFLAACIRHGDVVKLAAFAPVVNVRGAIFVHPAGIVKRTTYHVFWMYSRLLEKYAVPFEAACGELSAGGKSVPVLDAVLTESEDGSRKALAVANKHPSEAQALDVKALAAGGSLEGMVLDGDSPDAYNDIGAGQRVVPRKASFAIVDGWIVLPPHSVSVVFFGGDTE